MRRERKTIFWRAGALATSLLTTTIWAQAPIPVPASGPAPPVPGGVRYNGFRQGYGHGNAYGNGYGYGAGYGPGYPKPFKKHVADTFIGRPDDFVEPPLGWNLREMLTLMKSKADPHKFTLYRSDFLEGTDRLSPIGATRFNLMASRLSSWLGPVVIEWSPDQPGLAESRRTAVLAALQGVGIPVIPERVVISPSPYPGGLGADAVNYYPTMISRDQQAPQSYTLTPTSSSGFGFGGGGGGGSGGP